MFEIFSAIESCEDDIEKVELLRKHDTPALRKLLRYMIDGRLQFVLKDCPSFKSKDIPGMERMLYNRVRLLYLFVKQKHDVDKKALERLLNDMLESIDYRDAEIVLQLLKKKLPKGLTKLNVTQAFPGILDEQIKELSN